MTQVKANRVGVRLNKKIVYDIVYGLMQNVTSLQLTVYIKGMSTGLFYSCDA